MIDVICPNDGTILGQTDTEERAAEMLAHTKCSVCGWEQNPPSNHTALDLLELKSIEYIDFGVALYKIIKQKVWAINTLAIDNGTPMTTNQLLSLLSQSDTLEKTLKTGSFNTSLYVLSQLKASLPQYADVCDYATSRIQTFMSDT